MTEKWRAIPGFSGYEVSNLGNVRSWRPRGPTAYPPEHPRPLKACHIRQVSARGPTTARRFTLCDGTGGPTGRQHVLAGRLVLMAFVRLPRDGEVAHHINGDSTDDRLDNLRWADDLELKSRRSMERWHGNDPSDAMHAEMKRLLDEVARLRLELSVKDIEIAALRAERTPETEAQ